MRQASSSLFALTLVLLVVPAAGADPVEVTNFPRVQRVESTSSSRAKSQAVSVRNWPAVQAVEVKNRRSVTSTVSWKGRRVAPISKRAEPRDLEEMEDFGTVSTAGFRTLSVSLAGRYSGSVPEKGELELVLVPAVNFVSQAWSRDRVLLLEERVELELEERGKGLFQAKGAGVPVRFANYRVYVRNETAQELEVHLYMQLSQW